MLKKTFLFICIGTLAVIIGFFIGKTALTAKQKEKNIIAENIVNTVIANRDEEINIIQIPTSTGEEKISINTKIIEETYYNKCNHQIENTIKNTEKYINMTKEELEKEFPTWGIKEFGTDKVVLYKEEDDFCNEHFLVKDEDGYVTIYTINNEEEILELMDKTDIATAYLAKVDQDNLKDGMVIYTKQNLNKLIEDFE